MEKLGSGSQLSETILSGAEVGFHIRVGPVFQYGCIHLVHTRRQGDRSIVRQRGGRFQPVL